MISPRDHKPLSLSFGPSWISYYRTEFNNRASFDASHGEGANKRPLGIVRKSVNGEVFPTGTEKIKKTGLDLCTFCKMQTAYAQTTFQIADNNLS